MQGTNELLLRGWDMALTTHVVCGYSCSWVRKPSKLSERIPILRELSRINSFQHYLRITRYQHGPPQSSPSSSSLHLSPIRHSWVTYALCQLAMFVSLTQSFYVLALFSIPTRSEQPLGRLLAFTDNLNSHQMASATSKSSHPQRRSFAGSRANSIS